MAIKQQKQMQLSLLDMVPELTKVFFLDIFAESYYDSSKRRMRLNTIIGQQVPSDMRISCPAKLIASYPEGTIFKLDARLVRTNRGKRPYFVVINRSNLQRALEYFEYNLKVQNGFDFVYPKRSRSAAGIQARI